LAKGKSGASRSLLRLFFWEGLALAGLGQIHFHPYADHLWNLNFFYNALFFLVAYPILFVYRWKMTDGCLGTILWPVSYLLSWLLGASAYLWITYILLLTNSPYFNGLKNHELPLGILFAFIYFPLIQHLWGIGKKFYSLGELFRVLFYSALGGVIGYAMGWFISNKIPSVQTNNSQWFLLWLGFIFLGAAIGAFTAQRRGKD
jgi:hypothetical protein